MPRPLRLLLLLTPLLLFVGGTAGYLLHRSVGPDPAAPSSTGGRLVVLAVFDQMRGDYLDRWAGEFGTDGFERLKRDGVWHSDVTLPYACSATGPGHASIATGVPPSVHGIVENEWWDRGKGKLVSCCLSEDRRYERVPPGDSVSRTWAGIAPTKLLAPTVGDRLKEATNGLGRCFALSLKNRSAVLLGGKSGSAYCFDTRAGEFHTSSYYRDKAHPWVETFNRSGAADKWLGKKWERLKPVGVYDRLAGPDDQPGETGPRTFPYQLPGPDGGYAAALEKTPFGDELLWEFAKTCLDAEQLGRRGHPDLLCLGFSTTDMIGHGYGPDSHEVMDAVLRADRLVAAMLTHLDETVGAGNYTLIVTADHGICPLPEVSARKQPTARRFHYGELVGGLDAALDETFGPPDGIAGRWVDANFGQTQPWVYLNRRTVEASGVPAEVVEGYARSWLANRADAETAYRRADLTGPFPAGDIREAIRLGIHPDRCGDLYVLTKPYVLTTGTLSTGTNHGTPHPYDRQVFVLAAGAGVAKEGKKSDPQSLLMVAPLAAKALGVPMPGW